MEKAMTVFRMALYVAVALLAGTTSSAFAQAAAVNGSKVTIALLAQDQVVNTRYPWQRSAMAAAFENKLVESKRFRVVSQSITEAAMKQQNIAASGAVDPAQAIQIGKIVQAKYVIVLKQIRSNITTSRLSRRTNLDLEIQAQVINIETTDIAESRSYPKEMALTGVAGGILAKENEPPDESKLGPKYSEAVKEIAADFISNAAVTLMPFETVVLEAKGTQAILDGGNDVGLSVGAEFEVFKERTIKVATRTRTVRSKVARLRVTRLDTDLAYTTIVETYDDAEMKDATPNASRLETGALARYVPAAAAPAKK
jgi:hypothetical protein